MAAAKKRPVILKQQDEEMAEIDVALDEALQKLETANSRIQEVLQSVESAKNLSDADEGHTGQSDTELSSEGSDAEAAGSSSQPAPLPE